ncbi:peptide chain release factor N(5)-glutamine methyltransferase [Psychrobacter sanguinis]|uniref:peptide chain release factor N(5)-glutamine methyltransferase n=1 Tax=Psychrobacter sanguinis TaxID=861445 RepID=UPI0019183A8A|nr:peptide chain release factor N(5)-glutamine methyltransferase [Psychrobacter sanguinis]MCC3307170.1 peptide chain release factor N(5)-glutamine methyltransferase [Psychrobacter sanguinis]UEC24533.1 peptide chain release factor N(5)-glutamine methyltransferase [Psychrobacter sanguinis]
MSAQQRVSVSQIKKNDYGDLPAHWVCDWLLHILQKPPSFLITDGNYQLTDAEQAQFNTGIAQMQAGKPLAYLTGKQAFWSLEFEVNEHTLIPRPDTEVLVEQVLDWISQRKNSLSVLNNEPIVAPYQLLDLGTGSGCIAISLAHELATIYPKQWQVTALDFSTEALAVAKRNAQLNRVSNIEFLHSDWFSVFQDSEDTDKPLFDVIVSNPPYIVDNDHHLDKLKAEPLSALVAPDNGLGDIKQIAEQARDYLARGGLLAVEHGYDQGELVRQMFTDFGYDQVKTMKDYGGNDRVTWGVYG